MGKGYISIKSVIEYKIKNVLKEYETYKKIYTQEQIDENYSKYIELCYQRDDVNFILEDLYYWMQNGYNLNKTLEYIKEKNLNIKHTLNYIDYKIKIMTGTKGTYLKQYKLMD